MPGALAEVLRLVSLVQQFLQYIILDCPVCNLNMNCALAFRDLLIMDVVNYLYLFPLGFQGSVVVAECSFSHTGITW